MPFYIKKAFNLGPLRINLSKSGIGISAGVPGLRIGTGPKGNYVHGGKGGLYYRKNFQMPEDEAANESAPQLVDEHGQPLKQPKKRIPFWPFVLLLAALITLAAVLIQRAG